MTRIRLAVARESELIKQARPESVRRAQAAYDTPLDMLKALVLVNAGLMRGDITPQEGAELTYFSTHYGDAELAERIVLTQALCELSGMDIAKIRPLILGH